MNNIKLNRASVPPVTQEFFDRLCKAFAPVDITPDTPINDIMFSAGQQVMLRWIRQHVGNSTNHSDGL